MITYIYNTIVIFLNVIRTSNRTKGKGIERTKGKTCNACIESERNNYSDSRIAELQNGRRCIQSKYTFCKQSKQRSKSSQSKGSKEVSAKELILLALLLFFLMYTYIYNTTGFAFQRYEYNG